MVIQFYYYPESQPCQTVWMIIKELGIEYEPKFIDLLTGQERSEDYLKISPLHKVPAIKDGDFVVTDSRAIAVYLCQKYEPQTKKNKLYPTNLGLKETAKMNMNIFADLDGYHDILRYLNVPSVFYGTGVSPIDQHLPEVKSWLEILDSRLRGQAFLGADHLTVIDLYALPGISLLDACGFPHWDEFSGVQRWRKAMRALPYFDECVAEPSKETGELYRRQVKKYKEEHPGN